MELELRLNSMIGCFYPRNKVASSLTHIRTNVIHYHHSVVFKTMSTLLKSLILKELEGHVNVIARTLAKCVDVLTCLKLQSFSCLDTLQAPAFYFKKPEVPVHFEVPVFFALAISLLGHVRVGSLPEKKILSPAVTEADSDNYLVPTMLSWSAAEYVLAVEYAKKLGLLFMNVDLKVKLGSAWWFNRLKVEDLTFSLDCPLPADNYTDATVMLHSLSIYYGNTPI